MARTYLTIRCPHCGNIFDRIAYHGWSAPKRYGIPFKRCRFCGKDFVDKGISELAVKPLEHYQKRRARKRVSSISMWTVITLLVLFYVFAYNRVDGQVATWVSVIGVAVIGVSMLVRDANNDCMVPEELENAYKNSKLRLEQHPQYAAEVRALEEKRSSW